MSRDLSPLAHEGIPGHMYQTQYDHETFVYPIQYMLNNSGFTEGLRGCTS